jgi:hypothetical protein
MGASLMGANVEFDIYLKKEGFSFGPVTSLAQKVGLDIRVEEMETFDDWTYPNETKIDFSSLDLKTSPLFLERFTLTRFVVNDYWHGGLITSFEDMYIDLGFWLSLEDVMRTGKNDPIQHFYDQLTLCIDGCCHWEPWSESFLAVSMGIEYSAEFKNDIQEMLQDDNGVERWILPKEIVTNLYVEKFKREEKQNTTVFSCRQHYHEAWM